MYNHRNLTITAALGLIHSIRESIDLYLNNERYRKIVDSVVELEKDFGKVRGNIIGFVDIEIGFVDIETLKNIDSKFEKDQQRPITTTDGNRLLRNLGGLAQAWENQILFWSDLFQIWDTIIIDWEHHLAGFLHVAGIDMSDEFMVGAFEISAEPEIYRLVRMKIDLLLNKVWKDQNFFNKKDWKWGI